MFLGVRLSPEIKLVHFIYLHYVYAENRLDFKQKWRCH